MVRPKKPRFVEGVQLVDNLYADPKGRAGHYRYVRPDGSQKYFRADTPHKANQIAERANANRDNYTPAPAKKESKDQTMMGRYIEEFIEHRERQSPDLKNLDSWSIRKAVMRKYGRETAAPFSRLKWQHIDDWWQTLSYHQRKQRHTEFRRLFNYLMGRGLLKNFEYNPFTTADDRPRLYLGEKPARKRQRLDIQGFWAIYHSAGELGFEGIQIAMGLSLVTFMREQDILALQVADMDDEALRRVISKSEAQKGYARAERRQWGEKHRLVKQLVQRGRELSLKNGRCPFLISHRPDRIFKSNKAHFAQLPKERFAEQFRTARDQTGPDGKGLWAHMKQEERPTFHEVRSLADAIASSSGHDIKKIQHAMAHSNEAMTAMYQAHHELPFEEVEVVFDESMIGGDFSK